MDPFIPKVGTYVAGMFLPVGKCVHGKVQAYIDALGPFENAAPMLRCGSKEFCPLNSKGKNYNKEGQITSVPDFKSSLGSNWSVTSYLVVTKLASVNAPADRCHASNPL